MRTLRSWRDDASIPHLTKHQSVIGGGRDGGREGGLTCGNPSNVSSSPYNPVQSISSVYPIVEETQKWGGGCQIWEHAP